MKNMNKSVLAIGFLAATAMSASADTVVPIHHITGFDVQSRKVVMSAEGASWDVAHGCDLFLGTASEVTVRPAHKTPMRAYRANRVDARDSLVITVDGQKNVCPVEGIERTAPTFAAK